MWKSIDSSADIPFLSIDLSFNMTYLPRYKLVLDSTYVKVNGTYFKTKYISTCPQNILLVDPITLFPSFQNAFSCTYTDFYIDTLSTHMVKLHNSYSFGALSQNVRIIISNKNG